MIRYLKKLATAIRQKAHTTYQPAKRQSPHQSKHPRYESNPANSQNQQKQKGQARELNQADQYVGRRIRGEIIEYSFPREGRWSAEKGGSVLLRVIEEHVINV